MLMLAGMNGIIITGDLFNLFVFLEIASIASYADLIAIANANGASLPVTEAAAGITWKSYTVSIDDDGVTPGSYSLSYWVNGVPATMSGSSLTVTDQAITKGTH